MPQGIGKRSLLVDEWEKSYKILLVDMPADLLIFVVVPGPQGIEPSVSVIQPTLPLFFITASPSLLAAVATPECMIRGEHSAEVKGE